MFNLRYVLPTLPDGRIKTQERFVLVESCDVFLLLPWLLAWTSRDTKRLMNTDQQASEKAKHNRVL